MNNDKMIALTISGPIECLDETVRQFVVDKPFHPEDASVFLEGIRRIRRVEAEDPYTPCLNQADALLTRLEMTPAYAEYGEYTLEDTEAYLKKLANDLTALESEDVENDIPVEPDDPIIHCLQNVPEAMCDLWELKYVKARMGWLPEERWAELEALTKARPDEFAVVTLREKGVVCVLALALPEGLDDLDGNLARLGFERIRLDKNHPTYSMTAGEIIARTAQAAQREQERLAEVKKRREELLSAEGPELQRRRSWLAMMTACAKARTYAGEAGGRFYLAGWTPEENGAAYRLACAQRKDFTCVEARPSEVRSSKPPIRLRETGVKGILSPLMKMYGIPAYGSADPRIFMVITYTLFFGMMFGDAGQGLCIAALGYLLYKKTGTWLWRILSLCGLSAVVFGLIYGSVFGLEELLPWGGYHPLEADHIMPVLLAGAAVGVVVILVCMAFNVVNALRERDYRSAFFSPNGVCGAVLYVAVLAGIACAYTGVAKLFTAAYVILLILLPIALIWLGEPLGNLAAGKKNWQPESWGMYIVEGFFDIFESAISYMSNTMSFLRVGAFAISHAGMMMVVSMLSQGSKAAGSVLIMILGNIFVAGLEAALSSIQIIRLEFYEIFGRFYRGGGREFAPVKVSYTK